jgi:hypothetical protein
MALDDPLWVFVRPLNREGLRYMVTGATAAIIYGVPRLTNDLDVVLVLTSEQAPRLPMLFPAESFYCPPVEVMQAELRRARRGHFNIIEETTGYKGDFYPAGSDPFHAWALEHRRDFGEGGEPLWVAPPEYVIVRKLEYYREGRSEKHVLDIRAVLAVSGEIVDLKRVAAEVAARGLEDSWELVQTNDRG